MSNVEQEKLLAEIRKEIAEKEALQEEALSLIERTNEQLRVLRIREANITGENKYEIFELDISETFKTIDLPRNDDKGLWT